MSEHQQKWDRTLDRLLKDLPKNLEEEAELDHYPSRFMKMWDELGVVRAAIVCVTTNIWRDGFRWCVDNEREHRSLEALMLEHDFVFRLNRDCSFNKDGIIALEYAKRHLKEAAALRAA